MRNCHWIKGAGKDPEFFSPFSNLVSRLIDIPDLGDTTRIQLVDQFLDFLLRNFHCLICISKNEFQKFYIVRLVGVLGS